MIGLGTATAQLDTSVNIAFPAITRGFELSIGDIQWVVICYVLTYASLLLALGRIGDTIGHAVVYRAGLICSAVALLLVSCAPSYGAMLVFRCLQGIGAALVMSCGVALVTSLYGEERRSRALGIYTMMMALGWMLGPLLGGALTAIWDWPAVFWFRIPIAIAALLLLRGLPMAPPRLTSERFDILSGIALALGLVTMLMAINRIREFSAVWLGLLSVVAFAGFTFRQSRAERPIIAMDVLKLPGFALLNLVSVLANLAAFSVWLLVPYYLARMPGYTLMEGGAILAAGAAGAALAAPIGGRLTGRLFSSERLAIAGAAIIGAGLLLLGAWTAQTPTALRVTGLIVQGIGLGLFQLAYSDIVTATLPLTERGVAGSLALLTRTLGTVTAASVFFLVFEILQATHGFFEAFQQTFQLAAVLAFVAAGLLMLAPRKIGKA
ncbi:MFS transporter [Bradyrhizobium sp. JYMT SZCCT0428]|uniref:MFS transporter n=1 Tax=Bradyrhizobium sp. JYMT SZCCT0428 TaxID=2807673 RepID=UPI001BAE087D|nr:MFS transporter [Bradyrhizobium sp. JYMT SZCCT0428]MBR1151551.1 MFS transporter [Bradyrhizobium sp. JYMT SZCCT0428]